MTLCQGNIVGLIVCLGLMVQDGTHSRLKVRVGVSQRVRNIKMDVVIVGCVTKEFIGIL